MSQTDNGILGESDSEIDVMKVHSETFYEYALGMAYVNDGKITDEMAKRCGADVNKGKFQWMCPEVDWTEEWKKEYLEKTTGGVNK